MKKIEFLLIGMLLSVTALVSAKAPNPLENRDPDNYQLGNRFLKFNVETSFGVKNGWQDEYVYEKTDHKDKISELNWDMKPIFVLGSKLNLGFGGFWLGVGGKVGIGRDCGTVTDKDWMNYTHNDYSTRTHYSESDCRMLSYFGFDLSLLYRFRILSSLKFSPEVGLDYTLSEFQAIDAEYWYGSRNPKTGLYASDSSVIFSQKASGKMVKLKRDVFNVWLGANICLTPMRRLSLSVGGFVSPFTHVNSYDKHIARGIDFYDKMYGFFKGFKGNASAEYFMTRHYSAYFRFDIMGTDPINGNVYQKNSSSQKYYKTTVGGGCKFFSMDFSGGFRFRI